MPPSATHEHSLLTLMGFVNPAGLPSDVALVTLIWQVFHQMWSSSFSRLQRLLIALCAIASIGITYQSRVLRGEPGEAMHSL